LGVFCHTGRDDLGDGWAKACDDDRFASLADAFENREAGGFEFGESISCEDNSFNNKTQHKHGPWSDYGPLSTSGLLSASTRN
jgi:hypothetical protein